MAPRSWRLPSFLLLAAFLALAIAFGATGMHAAWWMALVPVGLVMGYAFGRLNADA